MDKKYFVLHLLPSRPDFAQTMTDEERAVMLKHVAYWTEMMNEGKALVFGPVLDPNQVYGLGIVAVQDEEEVRNVQIVISNALSDSTLIGNLLNL